MNYLALFDKLRTAPRSETFGDQTRKAVSIIFCLISLLFLVGCSKRVVEPPEPVHLKVAGSTSMQPLVKALAQAYTQRHQHVTITVEGQGSLVGIELVRQGQADIAMAACPKPEDPSLWSVPIALDGIAIVVHPQNRVEELTMLQLRDIFFGWVGDWKEVGGQAGDITVVSREDGSGTRVVFEDLVMTGKRVTPMAVVMPSSQAVVEYVAEHPEAIGYVSMGYLSDQVKILRIEGVAPTPESVCSGDYHLFRPFFLITHGEPAGETRDFIDFALNPVGQSIVGREYGRVKE